jgi:Domain of unknown function (DUF222)
MSASARAYPPSPSQPLPSRLPAGSVPVSPEVLQAALLARARSAARSWAGGEAAWAVEEAAPEAMADRAEPPSEEELAWLADPWVGPPDGAEAWLADLPGPLQDEYFEAVAGPAGPEPIKAGFWDRRGGSGGGYAAGGVADRLAPGPVLAGFTGDAYTAGLGRVGDDELIGVLRAARRLTSWAAAMELGAVAELGRRREAEAEASGEHEMADRVGAEVAAALTLTGRSAEALVDLADCLSGLPATLVALQDGLIDRQRAAVIAAETAALAPGHRAAVERHALARAASQTSAELRAATRRAVIAADPEAAKKRRDKAEREARVESWAEDAGTAALSGRDLPAAGVLAADQHLSTLARHLKSVGVPGTMDQLRAQVFLALLAGQCVEALVTAVPGRPGSEVFPQPAGAAGPGSVAPLGSINLTMPLATWLGLSATPADVAGFGPISAADGQCLAGLLAGNPASRWCVTLTGKHGHALGHGCARTGPAAQDHPPGPAWPHRSLRPPGPAPPAGITTWLAGISMVWSEQGACTHRRESPAYRPPVSLQHLINVRHRVCAFPGCRRPAPRCDQDHTLAFDRGGRTCECNLSPLCRRHHRCKQADGWRLEQPQPGVLVWRLPHCRSYTVRPDPYPV